MYWEDTDAGGVVYHAQYLAFLERARSEWMRAQGYGQDAAAARARSGVRGSRDDAWISSSRRGWTTRWRSRRRCCECRRASAVFAQAIRRGDELLLTATVRVAALDAAGFRPQAIPPPLYDQLKMLEQPVEQPD